MKSLLRYVSLDLKNMRLMEYSDEYSDKAKAGHEVNQLLSSDEHSEMSEIDFVCHYEDKDTLISWYFQYLSNVKKLSALGALAEIIKEKKIERILSFGCGPGVLEYILKTMFGNKIEITATDYDRFMVEKGNVILDPIAFEQFDFYCDDVSKIIRKVKPDLVLFFGSSCSMDDKKYVSFLSELHRNNVTYICSFEAGVFPPIEFGYQWLETLIRSIKRYLCGQANIEKNNCHAFARSSIMLRHIYKIGGYHYKKIQNGFYRYGYFLEIT